MDLTRCKKAELQDPATKRTVKADVTIGALDSLLITVPKSCVLSTDDPVTVTFLEPALGMVVCRCKLSSPLATADLKFCSYRCRILEELERNQRREDIKLTITVDVEIQLANTDTYAPATIYNISAGGVYLATSLAAQAGDRLTFNFNQAGPAIPLVAEVLRVENRLDRYGRLVKGYGCRFVRLSPRYEAQLRSFIFKMAKRQA